MMIALSLFCLLSELYLSSAFHVAHRASCTRKRMCNGNMMCANVCERGTVEVDQWAVNALNYQRRLQLDDKWVYFELPSSHNSGITEADGYGIEKYFISALNNGASMDEGDDLGEGVCQYLSLTDQLRMGVRHLEIDIWWGTPLSKEIIVCHSPVPLYPVGNVTRMAEEAGLNLEWDPKNMSCLGTRRHFSDVLNEVKTWMMLPENLDQMVVLYLDTKFFISPEHVTSANNEILSIFGDMLWKYSEGSPLQLTVNQLLTKGKRVMIENQREEWIHPSEGEAIVFYPAIWTHQFSPSELGEFPDCSVEGDYDWYGKQQVRALTSGFAEAATRCGVQVVSPDYINPDDMKMYVWSWDQQEPSIADGCTAMTPSGRWTTSIPCDTPLLYACRAPTDEAVSTKPKWVIDFNKFGSWSEGTAACQSSVVGSDLVFAAPHDGFANNLLMLAGYGQYMWLNAPSK
jgi:hypothetical protein